MAAFVASAVFKLAVIMEKSFTSSVVDVPLEVVRREMNSTRCEGRVSFAGFTKWKIRCLVQPRVSSPAIFKLFIGKFG